MAEPRLGDFLRDIPASRSGWQPAPTTRGSLNDEFDADIVYGPPRLEGLVVVPLGEETVTPLCTPDLAAAIKTPMDLLHHVLIESETKQVRWSDWFAATGSPPPPPKGSRFDRSFLAIAAAADGLGVALESTRLAERELASGRLVVPLPGSAEDPLCRAPPGVSAARRQRYPLKAFADWLLAELGVEAQGFSSASAADASRAA